MSGAHPTSTAPRSAPRTLTPFPASPRDAALDLAFDDERLSAWLDEALDAEELARFDDDREVTPELGRALEGLAEVLELARSAPELEAPPDFVAKVRTRVRRRQRARQWAEQQTRVRPPWEALFSVLAIAALMAVYMGTLPRPIAPEALVPLGAIDTRPAAPAELMTATALLATYGNVDVGRADASKPHGTSRVTVRLPAERVGALRSEAGLYPYLQVLEPGAADGRGHVEVAVIVRY